MKNPGHIIPVVMGMIFFLVGLGLVFGGVKYTISTKEKISESEVIMGEITEINTWYDSDGDSHHDVFVEYEYDGKEYDRELNSYSSSMYEGKEIELLVDMMYPTRVRSTSGSTFLVLILGGMGILFAAVGGGVMLGPVRKKAKMKKMIAAGYYVYAEVTGGYLCRNYTVNGRHPYKMECKYEDVFSGITHMFHSDYIWEDPQMYMGRQVKVYCNRDFSGEYYVDVDSLQNYM